MFKPLKILVELFIRNPKKKEYQHITPSGFFLLKEDDQGISFAFTDDPEILKAHFPDKQNIALPFPEDDNPTKN